MKQISAKGLKGTLIKSDSDLYFRVYSNPRTFIDYEILMHDFEIEIKDCDAFLKQNEVLDYSNETLGIYE